jgi:lipopolysaccharide/colanic/teichoic acid biosynthesis glycosyltransferase
MTYLLVETPTVPASGAVTSLYASKGKRALDLAFILLALPVLLPAMMIIVALTLLQGGSPFYSQLRIGQDGKVFRCWKIRTMVPNAEQVLSDMIAENPAIAEEWHRNQKLAKDPRITRIGAILRKTSLDELPQLLNVLNGTMSLVGPRPFMPEQQAIYGDGRMDVAYYRVRPGITGLWQIERRNAGSFSERALFDTRYVRRISIAEDLSILLRTVTVVMRATGK